MERVEKEMGGITHTVNDSIADEVEVSAASSLGRLADLWRERKLILRMVKGWRMFYRCKKNYSFSGVEMRAWM